MSIFKRAADAVYTFRFLKLLTTPWEETSAYELGIVDDQGKRLKRPSTSEEKGAYTMFHRLVYNVKRLINKAPGGSSKLASYASALYLVKEHYSIDIDKLIETLRLNKADFIAENSTWFLLENKQLAPGVYRVSNEKMLSESCELMVNKNDQVRIMPDAYPIENFLGLDIYEATHIKTQQKVFVTIGELKK